MFDEFMGDKRKASSTATPAKAASGRQARRRWQDILIDFLSSESHHIVEVERISQISTFKQLQLKMWESFFVVTLTTNIHGRLCKQKFIHDKKIK